jgi:hypothetical protein
MDDSNPNLSQHQGSIVNSSVQPAPTSNVAPEPVPQVPTQSVVQQSAPASPQPAAQPIPEASELPSTPPGTLPTETPVGDSSVSTITPSTPKKLPVFKVVVAIAIAIAVLVWAGVIFLFLQNSKMKSDAKNQGVVSDQPASSETDSEAPLTPDQIQISNGSVVRKQSSGDEVLVNKESYKSTGITGFARVAVSPDNKTMCFESWPPAPEPALYYSNIDGSNVKEVSPNRKNCLWLSDNTRLIYEGSTTNAGDIFIYNTQDSSENNLTLATASAEAKRSRNYSIVSLSADGSKIICKYESVELGTEAAGECEIEIVSGKLTIL